MTLASREAAAEARTVAAIIATPAALRSAASEPSSAVAAFLALPPADPPGWPGDFGLGGADRGRLRVGVGHVRHGVVVGLARLAEDVRGDDLALVLAHVGQQPDAGDVTDGPQPLPGAQVRVDSDALRAGLDADRFQAGGHARAPASGDEQVVTAQLAAVFEGQDVVVAVASRGGRLHAEDELDAVAAQHLAQRLAPRCGLAGQDVPAGPGQGPPPAQ